MSCEKCGLCKNIVPFYITERKKTKLNKNKNTILVVGPGPQEGSEEFFDSEAGKGVKEIASGIEDANVVYHEALSGPSYGAGAKELRYCREVTFKKIIKTYKPTVVIALGGNALYWATGEEGLTISAMRHKVVKEEDFYLMVLPHLSNDLRFAPLSRRKDCEDLLEEYLHVFCRAEGICKLGAFREPKNLAKLVRTKEEAWEALRATQDLPVAVMDTETGQSMHNLLGGKSHVNEQALTLWHKDSKLLCTSWTLPRRARDPETGERLTSASAGNEVWGDYDYLTYVLVGEANCHEINSEFCQPMTYRRLNEDRIIVGHNIKFDVQVFYRFLNIDVHRLAKTFDTFYWFSLRDSSLVGYGLKPLSKKYLGAPDWDAGVKEKLREAQKKLDERALKKGTDKIHADYRHLNLKELSTYCAYDTYWTARLYTEIVTNPFYESPDHQALGVVSRQAEALSRMERVGLPLDERVFRAEAEKNYEKLLTELDEFYALKLVKRALVKCPIAKDKNQIDWLNSKKFQQALVEVTKVHVPRTATGLPSLDKAVVINLGKVTFDKDTKELEDRNEFNSDSEELWFHYHKLSITQKLNSNFFNSYGKFIINGFMHTNFHICKSEKGSDAFSRGGGAATGRLSTGEPQSQNLGASLAIRKCFRVPKINTRNQTVQGRKLREFSQWERPFIETLLRGEDWLLVEADYNRIELVFLAVLSQDPRMLEILSQGIDFHEATARELFLIPEGVEVSKRQRDIAKTLNFGLVYGQGPKAFAEGAGIKLDEALRFFKRFHESFPGVQELFKKNEKKILDGEYIETIFGRRRSFRVTGDKRYDSGQERQANNYIVQSAASDSTTEHLHLLYSKMDEKPVLHKHIIPINTVHDSIWFLVRRRSLQQSCKFIKKTMEDTSVFKFPFGLPIEVEIKAGRVLTEMKKVNL